MALRVLAVAPPQYLAEPGASLALQSEDPASLFNACRYAAQQAEAGHGAWGESHWADSRGARRAAVLMLRSWETGEALLRQRLDEIRPNLLLIGSMSICLPGAVACGRIAKECLGENVCVMLGGRHATESIYLDGQAEVTHHASSPLRLMAEGKIPPVFDVVASGEGEHLIAALGELLARRLKRGLVPASMGEALGELSETPGRWILGTCCGDRVATLVGRGESLDYDKMPAPCAMFGVTAKFNVFDGIPTAHVYSDTGGGCVYDCTFCSERREVTGLPRHLETSADRLFQQLGAASRVIAEDYPGVGASAFCEDSTFLTFSPRLVERFVARMTEANLRIRLGGQVTIDQVLLRSHLLKGLRDVGLEYLFVGVETFSPVEIGGMGKDVRRRESWISRADRALGMIRDAGMLGGTAILFGLGESHASRLALIEQLRAWRRVHGMPYPISLNWAVQHPLSGNDGGSGYTYTDWAIPDGAFLEAFRDFGEASVLYPLAGQLPPQLHEVQEVCEGFLDLLQAPEARRMGD